MAGQAAVLDDFSLVKVLGKGGYGKVMLVQHKKDDTFYAMKMLRKENVIMQNTLERTQKERRVLEAVSHPFIATLHWAFQTAKKMYLVLEFCSGGELFLYLSRAGRFGEGKARFYTAEMTSAIAYLHSLLIIYRDLKPENLMLDSEGHCKITDFGLSREGVKDNMTAKTTICGTAEYIAPEILDKNGHGRAADWYSIGALTYEMMTGLPPYYTRDREKSLERRRAGDLTYPPYTSPTAQSLLMDLLQTDPNKRLGGRTENDGDEVKSHLFFQQIDWVRLDARGYTPPVKPDPRSCASLKHFNKGVSPHPLVVNSQGDVDSRDARSMNGTAASSAGALAGTEPRKWADRSFVHLQVGQDGSQLALASAELRKDREVVLAAVSENGKALQFASGTLRSDRDIVLAAVSQHGSALQFASEDLRSDRPCVQAAVLKNGWAMQYASEALRSDRDFMLTVVSKDDTALQYASEALRSDRDFLMAMVSKHGLALQYASEALRSDRDIVVAAVSNDGRALEYASGNLRKDFSVVRTAIMNTMLVEDKPRVLKVAEPPLNQNPDLLQLAGLKLQKPVIHSGSLAPELLLSVKFSLSKEASSVANTMYLKIMEDERFKGTYYLHNPNVLRKGFCGLQYGPLTPGDTPDDYDDVDTSRPIYGWSRNDDPLWVCLGKCEARCWKKNCGDPQHDCKDHENDPLKYSCWRRAYRHHLQKVRDTGGAMLQIKEKQTLGRGQQVELTMAQEVGVKVVVLDVLDPDDFEVFVNKTDFVNLMDSLYSAVTGEAGEQDRLVASHHLWSIDLLVPGLRTREEEKEEEAAGTHARVAYRKMEK